jgi:hypothetical protein
MSARRQELCKTTHSVGMYYDIVGDEHDSGCVGEPVDEESRPGLWVWDLPWLGEVCGGTGLCRGRGRRARSRGTRAWPGLNSKHSYYGEKSERTLKVYCPPSEGCSSNTSRAVRACSGSSVEIQPGRLTYSQRAVLCPGDGPHGLVVYCRAGGISSDACRYYPSLL